MLFPTFEEGGGPKIPFWSQLDIGPNLSRGGGGLQRFGNVPNFYRFLDLIASLIRNGFDIIVN